MCKLGEVFLAAAGAFLSQKLRSWDSITCNLHVFKCIYMDFHRFAWFCMDLHGFHAFQWIYVDLDGISMILKRGVHGRDGFTWFSMDLYGFGRDFSDSGLGCRDVLWQPVAACGGLWQKAVAPLYYHTRSLGVAGW